MNYYIKYIKDIALVNKYTKWYILILENAINRPSNRTECINIHGYVEAHHIVPKCICPTNEFKNDSNNLVFLTFREHLICHLLLCKMFNNINHTLRLKHACNAFNRLSTEQQTEKSKINSRLLESMKMEHISGLKIKYAGENNPFYGKSHTEETKVKMRKPKSNSSNMGIWKRTPESIEKLKLNRKGKCTGINNPMHSEENKNKVANSKIGRKLAFNPLTGTKKFVYPDNIPDGYHIP